MTETMDGVGLIRQERLRQVTMGWDGEHDDDHDAGQLAMAGAAYAAESAGHTGAENLWPWDDDDSWNPQTPLQNLIRAGALIAAEIDRRLRAGEH